MKALLLLAMLLAVSAPALAQAYPAPEGEIESKYDRFTDKTRVILRGVQVAEKDSKTDYQRIYLSVLVEFDSTRPTRKPNSVGIVFYSWSLWDDQFTAPASLDVIADEERKSFGEIAPAVREIINGKHVVGLTTRIAFDDLLRLTKAKKVEMRLGQSEFTFSDHVFKMLRDFAARVQP